MANKTGKEKFSFDGAPVVDRKGRMGWSEPLTITEMTPVTPVQEALPSNISLVKSDIKRGLIMVAGMLTRKPRT